MSNTYINDDGDAIPRTWTNVELGLIPMHELDDDELTRMECRPFTRRQRPPTTQAVVRKVQIEMRRRYEARFTHVLARAQQVMIDVMDDTTGGSTSSERLRAAQYVQERIVGKIPDKIEVQAEIKPWEGLIAGIENDV